MMRRDEFRAFQDACITSPLYKEAVSQFNLPEGFEVTIDPW
jgi:primary-amine oxidase